MSSPPHLDLHEGDGLCPEPATPVHLLLDRPLVHVGVAVNVAVLYPRTPVVAGQGGGVHRVHLGHRVQSVHLVLHSLVCPGAVQTV